MKLVNIDYIPGEEIKEALIDKVLLEAKIGGK